MKNKGAIIRFKGANMKPKFTTFEAVEHPKVPPMAYARSFLPFLWKISLFFLSKIILFFLNNYSSFFNIKKIYNLNKKKCIFNK